jgi:hypothetical protein
MGEDDWVCSISFPSYICTVEKVQDVLLHLPDGVLSRTTYVHANLQATVLEVKAIACLVLVDVLIGMVTSKKVSVFCTLDGTYCLEIRGRLLYSAQPRNASQVGIHHKKRVIGGGAMKTHKDTGQLS